MIIYDPQHGNFGIVQELYQSGLNIVPIKCDGSKSPSINWRQYSETRYPWYQCRQHFVSKGKPSGVGVICGITSGNLEVIDFDYQCSDYFPKWKKFVFNNLKMDSLPIVQTPKGGRHVYYRCETIEGNQKLSQTGDGQNTIVETRGQGGLVVAPGSPLSAHPTGKPYRLLSGDLYNVPTITIEQRMVMLEAARSFNEYVKPTTPQHHTPTKMRTLPTISTVNTSNGERPGDVFNRDECWESILEPHGWTINKISGDVVYWSKPNSYGNEHHATTNYGETDLLFVFSTSASPFEADTTYSKFAAYTILNHGGDFSQSARELSRTCCPNIKFLWEHNE